MASSAPFAVTALGGVSLVLAVNSSPAVAAEGSPPGGANRALAEAPPGEGEERSPPSSSADGEGETAPARSARDAPAGDQGDLDKRVEHLFETLSGGSMEERERAASELIELGERGAEVIPAIEGALDRDREGDEEARRAALAEIDAAVPDPDGRFRGDGRDDDDFDWLEHLFEQNERPGLGSVIADAAAVRALAATEDPEGGRAILDFAFAEDGLVIRDECGRNVRAMAPHSVPALIRAAGDREEGERKRNYAGYQLERLDREDPAKALAAAPDEALKIEIIRAYGDTQYREAVFSLIDLLDHDSPAVRGEAREAWLAYVTGEPPPPAPRRRLRKAGGELTNEPKPLYKNARELADHALRSRYARVFGEHPDADASLEELSHELFDHHDAERRAALQADYEEAAARAEEGDLEAAIAAFDRILVRDPEFAQRDEMVEVYLEHGESLRAEGAYRRAASALGKAYMLDPDGRHAENAREAQREAREALLAQAEDEGPMPSGPQAVEERPWFLFGGLGVGVLAVFFGVLGLAARRRRGQES